VADEVVELEGEVEEEAAEVEAGAEEVRGWARVGGRQPDEEQNRCVSSISDDRDLLDPA
jgi:hypothetical protein